MVRGKRHPDSREKWAATRLPRGAQRFASLPGSLQALTHQSRACHLLCAPPPRSRAHQPPTFRPPPFSYLPDCRLTLFPCFPYPPASSLTSCHPFLANFPFPPPPSPRRNTALIIVHPLLYALVTLPFFATRKC